MEAVKKPQLLSLFSSLLFSPGFPSCSRMLHRGILELLVSCKVAIDVATKQKSKDFMGYPCLDDAAMAYNFMAVLLRAWRYSSYPSFLSSFFFLPLTYWSLCLFTTTFLELAHRKVLFSCTAVFSKWIQDSRHAETAKGDGIYDSLGLAS